MPKRSGHGVGPKTTKYLSLEVSQPPRHYSSTLEGEVAHKALDKLLPQGT